MTNSNDIWLRILNEWRENNGLEDSIDDVDLVDVQVLKGAGGSISIEITVEEPVTKELIQFLKDFVPHKSISFTGVEEKEYQTVLYTPYFNQNPYDRCIQEYCDIVNSSYQDSNINPKWPMWYKEFILYKWNPFMYNLGLNLSTNLEKLFKGRKFCEWRFRYMWDEDDERKLANAINRIGESDYYSFDEAQSKFEDGWEFCCLCEGCQIEMDEECWLDSMAGATDWANMDWTVDYD